MAIRVGYFEDTNECYGEGPFVMVNVHGWRIEVGNADMLRPILPDASINGFLEAHKLPTHFDDEDLCACIVDYLNAKVRDKSLIIIDGLPIWDTYRYLHASKYFIKKSTIKS